MDVRQYPKVDPDAILRVERLRIGFVWFVVEADEPDKPLAGPFPFENCAFHVVGIENVPSCTEPNVADLREPECADLTALVRRSEPGLCFRS